RHRTDGGVATVRPDDDYRPSVPLKPDTEPPGECRTGMWRRYRRHPARTGLRSGGDCGTARAAGHLAWSGSFLASGNGPRLSVGSTAPSGGKGVPHLGSRHEGDLRIEWPYGQEKSDGL